MTDAVTTGAGRLELADWRRQTTELYAAIRAANEPDVTWRQFVAVRDEMFAGHPQSPLTAEQRATFRHLPYYPYNPAFRTVGQIDPNLEADEAAIDLLHDGLLRLIRVGIVSFRLLGHAASLSLFWIEGYGGGLFLPFKDLTNRKETFGGGRYLYDTIKGADIGVQGQEILFDFNFVYNPSCAYNAQWYCPLAPEENALNISIAAGEKRFENQ